MKPAEISTRGVLLTLLSTTLFALVSPYVKLLSPLTGSDIFAWRTIWTLPFALGLVMVSRGRIRALLALLDEIRRQPRSAVLVLACGGLLGLQQWLFLWAPLHGRTRDVSLGYFVLPIVMVLVGWLADRQRIHRMQWVAIALATVGVTHEFSMAAGVSWPLLVVALGLPPYFLLRRKLKHDSLTIFAAEMIVMLPVAIAIALTSATTHTVTSRPVLLTVMLPGLGLLSALSFTLYLKASRMLPMGIFGLLGYVEPILLAALSVTVFHEAIAPEEVWTFLPIALSVAATAVYVFTARPRPRRCRESADGRPGSHEAASGCHKA